MDELISRKDAIDALGEAPKVWTESPEELAALGQWEMDVTAIMGVPSANCDDCIWHVCNYNKFDWDVKPKTGKWKAYKDCEGKTRRITCNLCGWQSHSLCWYDYNYCPNCGAKMEGERYEE